MRKLEWLAHLCIGGGGHFLLMPLSLLQFSLYFRKSYSFLMGPIYVCFCNEMTASN